MSDNVVPIRPNQEDRIYDLVDAIVDVTPVDFDEPNEVVDTCQALALVLSGILTNLPLSTRALLIALAVRTISGTLKLDDDNEEEDDDAPAA